ncbi:MAG: superoxide dismutase [Chitinispirillales bacterium]|jgi:Fe-Mn family superoxide dismutase|nr:superoxide dismutase [Chitinispirillales bacterium]
MEIKGLRQIRSSSPFELPPLPYAKAALEPYISEKTISFHYEKHHQKYVTTANELIKGTQFEKASLEQIIKATAGNAEFVKLFNNAAQIWNHWFYWNSLDPRGIKKPQGEFLDAINSTFGSFDQCVKTFSNEAIALFGSGYVWLVKDGAKLKITKSTNANTPLAQNQTPLLTIDVWEHAYYLDYQNRRPDYVAAFLDNLINWEFAEANFRGY